MNLLEVRFTVLWVPSLPGPPGVFYSQIVHTEPPAVFRLWLWFPLQAQAPMVVSPWEASTSSVHPWASPVLGVAVCLLWQMQKEISLSFFLIYTHLSYLIQYQGLFFIFLHFFFFLFAPRFIEDWLLGFHVLAVSHLSSFLDYPIKIRACQPSPATLTSCTSSVQFSHSVLSDSLWPRESQHTRPPCPSPTSGVYPNSCPLSRWCHSTISSSVVPFSPCPQSFPASGSFPMSQHFRYYLVHSLTCLLSISY